MSKHRHHAILIGLLAPLVLMWPAFLNGYPFVYSDTSTYVSAGFEFETPADRPMTYGVFIWLTSLGGLTLWTSVYAQSWLLLRAILDFMRAFLANISSGQQWLVLGLLSAFTTASWTTSQLMPDIFTPVMLLSLVSFLRSGASRSSLVSSGSLFLLSCCMHASHIAIALVLILALWILSKMLKPHRALFSGRQCLIAIALVTTSIFSMGSALSKSKAVFFMGAMAEHGILKVYLEEHCPGHLRICAYKDSIPARAYQFIWEESGPVQRLGGFGAVNEEFTEIIAATLTDPKYIALHIRASIKATFDQLGRNAIGDGWGTFGPNTLLARRLKHYVPNDLPRFMAADQQSGTLRYMSLCSTVALWLTVASILAVSFMSLRSKASPLAWGTVAVLLAVVVNAWSCGTFANAIDRLGSKVSWLPCLMVLIWAIHRLERGADVRGTEDVLTKRSST
jgi:hypothetical protein